MTPDQTALNLVEDLVEARVRVKARFAFRASGMPFCQLKAAWSAMDISLEELPRESRKFFGDFYMDIGTAIHATMQRWLARLGILFGNWMCEQPWCGQYRAFDTNNDPIPTVEEKLGPQDCPSCGKEMTYCEFTFLDPPTGHCDGLLKFGEFTPDEKDFVTLEIKSVGKRKLETDFKVNGIPMSYKIQVELYADKLFKLGYNIVGVLFLFVTRESPRDIWPYWYKVGRKKSARIRDAIVVDHDAAQAAVEEWDFCKLSGSCETEEDGINCPYRVSCFSPSASEFFAEKLRRVVDEEDVTSRLPLFPDIAA